MGGDSFPGFVFLVSWLHRSHGCPALAGVCGVCGTGLLFENYIVDASILYKKQFPRYMNLDLAAPLGVVGFHGFLENVFDLCGQVFKSTRWMPWH